MSNELEQLALAQAVYKAVGAMVATGDPDNLRGRVDWMLLDDYADKGTDRYRIKVNGEEVGSISARMAKQQTVYHVEDVEALTDWLAGDGRWALEAFVNRKGRALLDFCASMMIGNGEIPPGCSAYTHPARIDGTVIKGCDPERVAAALGLTLPQAVMGLLGIAPPGEEPGALPEPSAEGAV